MWLCRKRGRSTADAQDLIQDAFLRLEQYRRRPGAQVENVEAFLVATVSNLERDLRRHERISSAISDPMDAFDPSAKLVDLAPTPDREWAGIQQLGEIKKALAAESERTCEIVLAFAAGYSYKEIAEALNVSLSTVQKHIARGTLVAMDLKEERGQE